MNPMDLKKMFEQAQQMQGKMNALQTELAGRRFEASAGAGMVTVVVSGDLRIVEIRFEQGLIEQGDRTLLEDLTRGAVNTALTNAQSQVQQEIQKLQASAMGGLGGLFNPGGGDQ